MDPHHAVLYFQNGKAAVQDSGSVGGLYVNGHQVTACEIRSVDEVVLGPFVLKTRVLGPAHHAEEHPSAGGLGAPGQRRPGGHSPGPAHLLAAPQLGAASSAGRAGRHRPRALHPRPGGERSERGPGHHALRPPAKGQGEGVRTTSRSLPSRPPPRPSRSRRSTPTSALREPAPPRSGRGPTIRPGSRPSRRARPSLAPGAAAAAPASGRRRRRRWPGRPGRPQRPARSHRPRTAALLGALHRRARQAADLLRALLARRAPDGVQLRAHQVQEAHHQRPGRRGDGAVLRLLHARGVPAGRVRRAGRLPGVPAAQGRAGPAPQRRALRRGRTGRGRVSTTDASACCSRAATRSPCARAT